VDGFSDKIGFIWSVADLLRGDYKAHEYGRVILPLTVLRRLDATLMATKAAVLAKDADLERQGLHNRARVLERVAGVPFYNTSPLDFRRLLDDPEHIAANLRTYIAGFSPGAADVLVKYGFEEHIKRLNEHNHEPCYRPSYGPTSGAARSSAARDGGGGGVRPDQLRPQRHLPRCRPAGQGLPGAVPAHGLAGR